MTESLIHSFMRGDLEEIFGEHESSFLGFRRSKKKQDRLKTLQAMFPDLEKEVLQQVLQVCNNNMSEAVNRLLDMTGDSVSFFCILVVCFSLFP